MELRDGRTMAREVAAAEAAVARRRRADSITMISRGMLYIALQNKRFCLTPSIIIITMIIQSYLLPVVSFFCYDCLPTIQKKRCIREMTNAPSKQDAKPSQFQV